MGYRETLAQMIQNSEMKLREIAERAREKGHSLDASYLSKLQTGKLTPASAEINRAIAKACNGDVNLLVWEGYMEKAPEIIRNYVNSTLPLLKHSMKTYAAKFAPPDQAENFKQLVNKLSPIELVRIIGTEPMASVNNTICHNSNTCETAGEEFDANLEQTIGIPMKDDSMEPLIPYKSILRYKPIKHTPANGSIVIVDVHDKLQVRRFYCDNHRVSLIPENLNYSPIFSDMDQINLIGIIKEYTLHF